MRRRDFIVGGKRGGGGRGWQAQQRETIKRIAWFSIRWLRTRGCMRPWARNLHSAILLAA